MSKERDPHPELAQPYFTRQAQVGRRVVFSWRPADASPHNPLTTPWPNAEELIEGVEFADEEAARRFDLDRTVGARGRPQGRSMHATTPPRSAAEKRVIGRHSGSSR